MSIAEIYEKIATEYANLGSMREAYDKVMGEGAYEKMAGEVYEAITARWHTKSQDAVIARLRANHA